MPRQQIDIDAISEQFVENIAQAATYPCRSRRYRSKDAAASSIDLNRQKGKNDEKKNTFTPVDYRAMYHTGVDHRRQYHRRK